MSSSPTALYRHFDKNGKLLYVGISLSVVKRLGQHKLHAHWYMRIARIDVEWFNSREEASHAEMLAIQDENPECNVQRPLSYEESSRRRIYEFRSKHREKIAAALRH